MTGRRSRLALLTAGLLGLVALPAGVVVGADTASASTTSVVTLQPVDGGSSLYGRFASSSSAYFPIGVWMESVTQPSDTAVDKAAGLNTYLAPTDNSVRSYIQQAGMTSIGQIGDKAWFNGDEVDMGFGPGWDPWNGGWTTGTDCTPAQNNGGQCGYTVMSQLSKKAPSGQVKVTNYGKGVEFWENDAQASVFVNNFQDVVSDDIYWMTDNDICSRYQGGMLVNGGSADLTPAQCQLPANYALSVRRLRQLVQPAGSKPVWGFVEVGHPSDHPDWPSIQPADIPAAVWGSIIGGARGITYFNHSFAGPCPTQHALREPCYAAQRSAVTTVNGQITQLAPVLNSPTASNAVTAAGTVQMMVKYYNGQLYLFAINGRATSQQVTFSLACTDSGTASVQFEHRAVEIRNGTFTDTFADRDAVHIYQLPVGSNCTIG